MEVEIEIDNLTLTIPFHLIQMSLLNFTDPINMFNKTEQEFINNLINSNYFTASKLVSNFQSSNRNSYNKRACRSRTTTYCLYYITECTHSVGNRQCASERGYCYDLTVNLELHQNDGIYYTSTKSENCDLN
uniref:Uncharacterized protein n=1 Tax=viral metagenome TaxID=1070528 RepID=A0A6C0ACU1_9ZZZZ